MSNRLSHSAINVYKECGRKYKLQYKDKLRSKSKGSPLFFGTAVDKALEYLHKNPTATEEEVQAKFELEWENQDINGKMTYLPTSLQAKYNIGDFDIDLLTQDDIECLLLAALDYLPHLIEDTQDLEALFTIVASHKKQAKYKTWAEEENIFFNICCHTSLLRKGSMMLSAHRKQILPRFKEVMGSQIAIKLESDQGDALIGYVDIFAKWEDGRNVVFDYKTSSKPYPKDAVKTSPQLSIYAYAMNETVGGYIVFNKKVVKITDKICSVCGYDGTQGRHTTCPNLVDGVRCNSSWIVHKRLAIDIQVLIDDIPKSTEEKVLADIEKVNQDIKSELFEPNYEACQGPYGKCDFYEYCHEGSSDKIEKV